jgi:kynurenine formamidase
MLAESISVEIQARQSRQLGALTLRHAVPAIAVEDWLMHNRYTQAEGVANLDQVPEAGALVVIGYPSLRAVLVAMPVMKPARRAKPWPHSDRACRSPR